MAEARSAKKHSLSQKDVDFGRHGLTASGGEILSRDRGIAHVATYCLHDVGVATAAQLTELRSDTALDMASGQRQERNVGGDELLPDDAGLEETVWRERKS